MKNRAKWSVVAVACMALLVFGFSANQPGVTQASETEFDRTVSVSGEVTLKMQPDLAVGSVGVKTEAKTANEAARLNAEKTDAVIKALKRAGVNEEDITTQNYTLQENRKWVEKEYVTDGYYVINSVVFETETLQDVGKLLDAAVAAGANIVNTPRFTVKDQDALKIDLLKRAMANAKLKAQALVESADASLGPVVTINEQSIGGNWYRDEAMKVSVDSVPAYAATPIKPGEVELSARIHVVFAIK